MIKYAMNSIEKITMGDLTAIFDENDFIRDIKEMYAYRDLINQLNTALPQQLLLKRILNHKKDIPAAIFLYGLFEVNFVLGKVAAYKLASTDFIWAKRIAKVILNKSSNSGIGRYKRIKMSSHGWNLSYPEPGTLAQNLSPPDSTGDLGNFEIEVVQDSEAPQTQDSF